MLPTTCALVLATFIVGSFAERISNVESPSARRSSSGDGYGFDDGTSGSRGSRPGSPSFEGDGESVRSYADVASGVTDSPYRRAYTATRSSYLSGFTTQRESYRGSSVDRDSEYSGSYAGNYGTSRRPSYQTDRWGDVLGGERTTRRAGVYGSYFDTTRSPYISGSGSIYGRNTPGYGDSIYGSGSAGGLRDPFDRNNAYVRIQAELVKLTNEKGLASTGSKCDVFGACDTVCYGYIDTERPNSEFPGSRDQKYWPKLFEAHDNNSPTFTNAEVTREVCGVPYRESTFRVYCEDKDTTNSNDLINKWDCNIQRDPEGETFATWHSGECQAKFQPDKMRLTFRYKIHTVPRTRCDPTKGSLEAGQVTSTTRRSGRK